MNLIPGRSPSPSQRNQPFPGYDKKVVHMKKSGSTVAKDVEALGKVLSALADVEEEQRGWIIAAAVSKFGIAPPTIHSTPIAGTVNQINSHGVVAGKPGSKEHAKDFVRSKNAPTDVLRAVVLGYYLTHFKNKVS